MNNLPDIQNSKNNIFQVDVDYVGIKNVKYPILIKQKWDKKFQHTIGTFSLYCDLHKEQRGAHLSRFIEILNKEIPLVVNINSLHEIVKEISLVQESETSQLEVMFKYFIPKTSPVSKLTSLLDYDTAFYLSYDHIDTDFYISVSVPITTLCPCSKEISEYNAHNQRAKLTITILQSSTNENEYIWIEDLVEIAEKSCSSQIYPLLKREDEKHVTETMYNNPLFVEDVVRLCAKYLDQKYSNNKYRIECESYESIHNHIAYASVDNLD